MDLVLTLIVCFAQFLLGLMGIYVALRPPQERSHRRWIAGFVLLGFVGIFATAWLAKQSGDTLEETNTQLQASVTAATNANKAATDANAAATAAHNAAAVAQEETEQARKEAAAANAELQHLINRTSGETNATIKRWRSDTETAVSRVLRPPRILTIEQRRRFVQVLRTLTTSLEISVRHAEGSDESQRYADQLIAAIQEAGWRVKTRPKFLITVHEGYGVIVAIRDTTNIPPEADKLIQAFKAAGIDAKGTTSDTVDSGAVDLYVGLE